MYSATNHIVHTLHWSTSIDEHNLAGKLQNKISHWSNFHFERESSRVLDRICPDNQCWRIPYLELDLGDLDYSDLEAALSQKVPKLLEAKIQEYILQQQWLYQGGMADEQESRYGDLLEALLLDGTLPWWSESVALNDLMLERLSGAQSDGVNLIRQLAKNVAVRKRLAWQLTDTTLKALVKAVEPANAQAIIAFKADLQEAQEVKGLVSASKGAFEKSIWFWILNYLFEERGTTFNKVTYLHSLIVQMAAHYNLSQQDLLASILTTVHKIQMKQHRLQGFYALLKQVSEFGGQQNKLQKQDSWGLLEVLLSKQGLTHSTSEINQVIYTLLAANAQRLIARLKETGADQVARVLEILDSRLLVKLLEAIAETDQQMVEYCTSIAALLYPLSDRKNRKLFYQKLVKQYLRDDGFAKAGSWNAAALLSVEEQLELQQKLWTSNRRKISEVTLRIADDVFSLLAKAGDNPTAHIEGLLHALSLKKGGAHEARISMGILLQKYPKEFLNALREWKDKAQLKQFLPLLLNDYWLHLLAESDPFACDLLSNLNALTEFELSASEYLEWELLNEIFFRHVMQECILNSSEGVEVWLQKAFVTLEAAGKISTNGGFRWLEQLNCSVFFQKHSVVLKGSGVQRSENEFSQHLSKSKARHKRITSLKQTSGVSATEFEALLLDLFGKEQHKKVWQLYRNLENRIQEGLSLSLKEKALSGLKLCFADFQRHKGVFEELNRHLKLFVEPLLESEKNHAQSRRRAAADLAFQHMSFVKAIRVLVVQNPHAFYHALLVLHQHFVPLISPAKQALYDRHFMQAVYTFHRDTSSADSVTKKLVSELFNFLSLTLEIGAKDIAQSWQLELPIQHVVLQRLLRHQHQLFELLPLLREGEVHRQVAHYHDLRLLEPLCTDLIEKGTVPAYALCFQGESVTSVLKAITETYPIVLLSTIEKREIGRAELETLVAQLPYARLIPLLRLMHSAHSAKLHALSQVFEGFRYLNSSKIRRSHVQLFLYAYTLNICQQNAWQKQSAKQFWIELTFELSKKLAMSAQLILEELAAVKYSFPLAYQTALHALIAGHSSKPSSGKTIDVELPIGKKEEKEILKTFMRVKNAGIVLFNNYISMLFERLGLMAEDRFVSDESRFKAVNLLQYVATGNTQNEEHHLVLNKVLCGLHPSDPIPTALEISTEEKQVVEGMIQAMISHWPVIGESSVDGFRGNWVVRDGLLSEESDHWELSVEKRAYDLLLDQSPFSFSIIKYPWMKNALKVNWPY
jgi:hypothetical protein